MWIQIMTWGTTNNVITTNLSFEPHLFSIVDNIGFGTQFYLVEGWKSEKNINYFIYFCFPPCVFGKEDGKVQGIENITLMLLLIEVEWWKSLDAIFFFSTWKKKKWTQVKSSIYPHFLFIPCLLQQNNGITFFLPFPLHFHPLPLGLLTLTKHT